MSNELVSVIMTAYNVEKYILKSIESVINQTYKNLEIIIIDDGSTDETGEICNEFAASDARIKLIHKRNTGLADSRNVALDLATGEYLFFIDSDDYIEFDLISILYNELNKNNAEIAQCLRNRGQIKDIQKEYTVNVYSRKEIVGIYLKGGYSEGFPSILCKKQLFDNLRFYTGKAHEDTFAKYKLLESINTFVLVNYYGYFYTQREGSLTHAVFSDSYYDKVEACRTIYNYYKNTGFKVLAYKKYVGSLIYFILISNGKKSEFNKKAINELSDLIKNNGLKGLKIKFIPFILLEKIGLLKYIQIKS